jgi:histidinol-phosphate aminotransferase
LSCDFIELANPGVQRLHPYQAGKPIEELQRELGLTHIVKLASNENPMGPSPAVIEACRAELAEIIRYPDSNGFELKAALAAKLNVAPAQLTLGNGSNDLIDLIAKVFLGPDTSGIYSQYGFAIYALAIQACNARGISVPARNWGHDLQAMAAAVEEDTRLIYVANPNNPTGTAVGREELLAFLRQVPASVVVVIDEAYTEYVEDPDFPNAIELLEQFPNLVVFRTFSKAYGLAGLRVGYSVSSPQLADLLNRVRAPFNVSSVALAAAVAALGDDDYLERSRALNREGMQQLIRGCEEQGIPYIPSLGNFLTIEVGPDAGNLYQRLLREGVIVRPLAPYQMPNHLRVSIGLPEENAFFLDALKRVR